MEVTFENYQMLAAKTLKDLGSKEKNLQHMRLGILDEVGEIAKLYKKALVKGEEVDMTGVLEEVSDLGWFITNAVKLHGGLVNFSEMKVATINLSVEEYLTRIVDLTAGIDLPNTAGYMLHYWVTFVQMLGLDLSEVLQKNIEKLAVRHGDKFREDSFENRDVEAERAVLEN